MAGAHLSDRPREPRVGHKNVTDTWLGYEAEQREALGHTDAAGAGTSSSPGSRW